jgi:hypothetical protein
MTEQAVRSAIKGPRPSQLLRQLGTSWRDETISLRDVLDALGDRAYSFLVLVLALPNVIPNPVIGLSTILGAPLALIILQRMIGRDRIWLPRLLTERSIAWEDFGQIMKGILPVLERLEGFARPRFRWLGAGDRMLTPFSLLLAVVLALPIPFGNIMPALAISLIALGSSERDGLAVAIGIAVGLAGMTVVWTVVGAVALLFW